MKKALGQTTVGYGHCQLPCSNLFSAFDGLPIRPFHDMMMPSETRKGQKSAHSSEHTGRSWGCDM